jgi:hypothetical protein
MRLKRRKQIIKPHAIQVHDLIEGFVCIWQPDVAHERNEYPFGQPWKLHVSGHQIGEHNCVVMRFELRNAYIFT